jgi:hypothetical protein
MRTPLVLLALAAHAEPLPQPKPPGPGGSCPFGYTTSNGFCVPSQGASSDAIPKLQSDMDCHTW